MSEQRIDDSTVLPDAQGASAASNEHAAASGQLAQSFAEAAAIATDGRACQCHLCIRTRNFLAALETIPEQHHRLLHAMHGALEDAEFERDHARAVIEGSYPDADTVIAYHRKRRAISPDAAASQSNVETPVKHEEAPGT